MDELGPYAFGSTAENADRGIGNVDPRKSIRQAAAIRLSEAGASWLGEELEDSFRRRDRLLQLEGHPDQGASELPLSMGGGIRHQG
jgi:hypothetical protein